MKLNRAALELLCDEIIKHASPNRGMPPENVKERREERPTHLAPFLDKACSAKARLVREKTGSAKPPLTEEQCSVLLQEILLCVLNEASQRNPHAPAYLDVALDLCLIFRFPCLSDWFYENQRTKWNEVIAYKIEEVACALFRQTLKGIMAHK